MVEALAQEESPDDEPAEEPLLPEVQVEEVEIKEGDPNPHISTGA